MSVPDYWGNMPENPGPLARYLPPLPEGIVTYLAGTINPPIQPGSWILDPFGASPRTVLELAHAGYRILVAANNPIARFLIEMSAQPPPETEFRAALAELASARKGEERIEPHIRGLYTTDCARCGRSIEADTFLWEREAASPYARIYTCPYCGDTGEHSATPGDAERASIAIAGLHRSRALERVAPINDPDRPNAEEALAVYPPRAVYALFTLINKLDGISFTPIRRRCLEALLLTTCDQANTLWAYPTSRERPRQLSIPPRYRENNIWQAIEASIALWTSQTVCVPLVTWHPGIVDHPYIGGEIYLYEGKLRDLAENLDKVAISAVITALPRPNQAFWTLSALWAGWLWGKEAVGPFKSVLRRRRYDWAWHTTAMASTLKALADHLTTGIPFVGMVGEVEPGFLKAAIISADMTGFNLKDVTLREAGLPAYIRWQFDKTDNELFRSENNSALTQSAINEFLKNRGEPADYLHLSAAAVSQLAKAHRFRKPPQILLEPKKPEEHPADLFNQTQSAIRDVLSYRGGLLRYGSGETFDTGTWWLREASQVETPLADRVEMLMVRYLIQHPGCTMKQIDQSLCEEFPGILIPDADLLQVCLESYATQEPAESGIWFLKPADTPANRREEINTIHDQIGLLAQRLGYRNQNESPVLWLDASNQARFWFYIKASAVFSEILLNNETPANRSIIIFPGSRANLVVHKLRHDPRLQQLILSGWRFLKFRHLRWLLETPLLSIDNFDEQMNSDPLTYNTSQQRLF